MLQSRLFTKTRREAPKDEVSVNANLLIRGGFIDKLQSGVYTYLPLGLLVLKKVEKIIREEVNSVGAQEVLMPSLQPKENWQKTGRWDSMSDLYKVVDSSGKENALGPTHEEIVVPLVKHFVNSYKDLPLSVYQFQNKFRMELRAKSGILRGREFIMKDMYSFHESEADMKNFYERMKGVYKRIFERLGLGDFTHLTFASGGTFSKFSHEFQTVTESGEDIIHICRACGVAVNDEILGGQKVCPECGAADFSKAKSIEVGNIFELKTKFTAPFDFSIKDRDDNSNTVIMGCYGIGLGRVMGAIVEVLSDAKGIIWPEAVAPFKYHLVEIAGAGESSVAVKETATKLYSKLSEKEDGVLYDDRDLRAGEKFEDADLIGAPWRVVVSGKTVEGGLYEVKNRKTGEVKMLPLKELLLL